MVSLEEDARVHLLVGDLEQMVDVVVVDFDASDRHGKDVILVDVDQLVSGHYIASLPLQYGLGLGLYSKRPVGF